jgi:hypothetical protein
MGRTALIIVCACGMATAAQGQVTIRGQGSIRGVAHDSLLRAPLAGAEVWVRGTTQRAVTDSAGRFRFDTVAEGRHLLVLSHPGLDSVGLFNLAAAVTVETGRVTTASLATPSLGTIWSRRCPEPLEPGADSGVVLGVVTDAATGNLLAGAVVVGTWVVLAQRGVNVTTEDRAVVTRTDSVGAYTACGLSTDATVHARAYGAGDSSGAIQVRPGPRALARRDFSVGPTRRGAALRGRVIDGDGRSVAGARVAVDSAATLTADDGGYVLAGLHAGTHWLSVRAVSRAPVEQAVDLRDGDTLVVDVSLGGTPVMLDTVRVAAPRYFSIVQGIEDRKKRGFGVIRDSTAFRGKVDIAATLSAMPSLRVDRRRGSIVLLLPGRSMSGLGGCVATVYLDGFRVTHDQLLSYTPDDLVAVEVYQRGLGAPIEFPGSGCGVVLVWTKYLR